MKKLLISIFLLSVSAFSSDIGKFLEESDKENIEGYVKPFITALGLSLNNGNNYTAAIDKEFHFSFRFKTNLIFIPESQKTYKPVITEEGYTANKKTATILGGDGAYFSGPNGYIVYPDGIGEAFAPFAYPVFEFSYHHTSLSLFTVPTITVGDFSAYALSLGLKHSFGQYFRNLPVDLAAQFNYSSMGVSDMIELSAWAVNTQVSKKVGLFTYYGILQYENAKTEITVEDEDDDEEDGTRADDDEDDDGFSADFNGDNGFGITVGSSFQYQFLILNGEFNYNSQYLLNFGVTFQF